MAILAQKLASPALARGHGLRHHADWLHFRFDPMGFITLPSATVHYTDSGAGVPIVLLHANPGDSRDFDAVLPALAQQGRVLALDWPGYGASPPPAVPQQLAHHFHARLLREFVDALALDGLVLIGNSLGGTVALQFALAAPQRVRKLVLVAPGGFTQHNLVTRFFSTLQSSRWALHPHRWASLYLCMRTQWTRAMLQRARTTQASASALAVNRAIWRLFTQPSHDLRQVAAVIPGRGIAVSRGMKAGGDGFRRCSMERTMSPESKKPSKWVSAGLY